MSYNNERGTVTPFYFDIETIGNQTAVSLLDPVKANGNLKDPAKIAANIAEKEQARAERAALDCDTARIVCVGYDFGIGGTAVAGRDELAIIAEFWNMVRAWQAGFPVSPLVGFNVLAFDLPVLIRRSQLLGVPYPSINLGKYRHDGVIDLMQTLTWDGLVDAKSLSAYCRLFGITAGAEDAHDGSEIAALYAAGDWDAIGTHCRADVAKTRALAERIGAVK